MKVGLVAYSTMREMYKQIWRTIGMDLCEPVEFVPFGPWKNASQSYIDAVIAGNGIDTLVDMWTINKEREKVVKFSTAVGGYHLLLVIPDVADTKENATKTTLSDYLDVRTTFSVFSSYTWYSILSLVLIFLAAGIMHHIALPHGRLNPWRWYTYWVQQHGMPPTPRETRRSKSILVLIIVSGVFTMHSLGLYQGCLLSQLVKETPFKIPFRSFDDVVDMIEDGEAKLNLIRPEFHLATLLKSNDSSTAFKKLRAALRVNAPVYVADSAEWESSHDQLLLTAKSEFEYFEDISDKACDSLWTLSSVTGLGGFMFSPYINSSRLDCVNRAIAINIGRIQSIFDRELSRKKQAYQTCRIAIVAKRARVVGDPIRLVRLSGSVAIWLLGTFVAAVAFGTEFLVRYSCFDQIQTALMY